MSDPGVKEPFGRKQKRKEKKGSGEKRYLPSRIRRRRTRHHRPNRQLIYFPVQRPECKGGWLDGFEGRVGGVDHEPARGEGQGLKGGGVEAGFGGETPRVEGGEMVMFVVLRGDAEEGCGGDDKREDREDEEGDGEV